MDSFAAAVIGLVALCCLCSLSPPGSFGRISRNLRSINGHFIWNYTRHHYTPGPLLRRSLLLLVAYTCLLRIYIIVYIYTYTYSYKLNARLCCWRRCEIYATRLSLNRPQNTRRQAYRNLHGNQLVERRVRRLRLDICNYTQRPRLPIIAAIYIEEQGRVRRDEGDKKRCTQTHWLWGPYSMCSEGGLYILNVYIKAPKMRGEGAQFDRAASNPPTHTLTNIDPPLDHTIRQSTE